VLPFLLLGFVALRVPWLVPWRDGRRAAFFTAQLALTAAYAVVGTAGLTVLWNLDALLFSGRPVGFDPLRAAWQAFAGGMIYLVIAGGAYAWQNDQRVREEAARAARAEALRTKAELAALRSQLNPHFLLNTLHAALGLVRRDPPLAERALERLGEVLHYGLRMHRESLDQVPLADEWSFVKSYLEIESLRLEERLRLSLEAEPEALMERVPPFVLQPLVENAIRHAVAPRKDGGRVAVSVRRRGDRLLLEVSDDGPGMPSASPGSGAGVGLRLLRERLALLYAGRASLSVQAAEASGVRATIELPLDREPATEPV
jgi:LytS/YehU family sensor histidine kinase